MEVQPASTDVEVNVDVDEPGADAVASLPNNRRSRRRVRAVVGVPILVMLLILSAGYLKWRDGTIRAAQLGASHAVQAATEDTIAMLSYQADTVDRDLRSAQDRLTGDFRDAYTRLITDVVIPGAKQQHISAVATVPAAASVAASENHAVVLVFVNQTTTIGNQPPSATTSSVRVTLDKVDGRWLVSKFDPI